MRFGFQVGVADPVEHAFGDIARFPWGWQYLEPSPGVYDFASARQRYNSFAAHGQQQIVTVDTPALRPGYDWDALIRAVVQEFPDAAALEVINEPNLQGKFSPSQYAALFTRAHAAARAVGFGPPILVAAPARVGDWEGYLRATFKAGIPHDAELALHPYPTQVAPNARWVGGQIDAARKVLKNRSGHGRIWVTETGVSTGTTTPTNQARVLEEIVETCRRKRVKACVIFRLADPQVSINAWEDGLGVRTRTAPKPAYTALQE